LKAWLVNFTMLWWWKCYTTLKKHNWFLSLQFCNTVFCNDLEFYYIFLAHIRNLVLHLWLAFIIVFISQVRRLKYIKYLMWSFQWSSLSVSQLWDRVILWCVMLKVQSSLAQIEVFLKVYAQPPPLVHTLHFRLLAWEPSKVSLVSSCIKPEKHEVLLPFCKKERLTDSEENGWRGSLKPHI
jgi:hypothetical protein